MNSIKNLLLIGVFVIFALSRWYIYANPPLYYSDVKADYERYANMWRYGLPPYLKHLYEYPPATIPLLSIPLSLDQAGIGKYYPNYRAEILLIDIVFFCYLVFIIRKIPWLSKKWVESLLAYILLTTLAKDFFYEGIDLAFTSSMTVALTLLFFLSKDAVKSWFIETLIWVFFWLSVAIKFFTFPLSVPLFLLLHRGKLTKQIATSMIGFLIVWGIPLALYRSSLQVMFVHNNNRPLKYASFSSHVIRWVNSFTHSEEQYMVAPDFPFQGPVSNQITNANKVIFPTVLVMTIGTMAFTLYSIATGKRTISIQTIKAYIFKPKVFSNQKRVALGLWFYVSYLFILFLSAKIFSQPFHIWYMAPVVLLPFTSKKAWYTVIGLCVLMVLLDMTTVLHIKNNFLVMNTVEIGLIRDAFRFIPMFVILGICFNELRKKELLKTN